MSNRLVALTMTFSSTVPVGCIASKVTIMMSLSTDTAKLVVIVAMMSTSFAV